MNDQELQHRLEALGRSVPASDGFTQSVMGRLATGEAPAEPRNLRITRWVVRGAIGVAACVVAGAFAWALLVDGPQRAYGMEEVAKRLRGARSIYLSGRMGAESSPFALYADRLGRAWRTDGAGVTVAVDGTRRVARDDRAKTWTVSKVGAIDARLAAEGMFQNEIMGDLLGIGREEFKKVRTERVGNVAAADVYEGRHKAGNVSVRVELAVDPRAGTPLRADLYFPEEGNHFGTIDRIDVDGPPPAGAFDAAAPAGFKAKSVDLGAEEEGPAEWGANGLESERHAVWFRMRYAFALPGRSAVLVCWALYDAKRPTDDLAMPGAAGTRVAVNGGGGYDLRTFRTDATAAGYHWRWSVAVPRGGGPVGVPGPSIDVTSSADEYHLVIPALTFPREELAGLVEDAQRVTLPVGQEPTRLEDVERLTATAAK